MALDLITKTWVAEIKREHTWTFDIVISDLVWKCGVHGEERGITWRLVMVEASFSDWP